MRAVALKFGLWGIDFPEYTGIEVGTASGTMSNIPCASRARRARHTEPRGREAEVDALAHL